MKPVKILGLILSVFVLVMILGSGYYVYLFYPRSVEQFEINSPDQPWKILLVRQGSAFKTALIDELCDSLKQSSVYIKGIDVKDLDDIRAGEWNKILITTTYMARLNRKTDRFINQSSKPGNVLLLVTSGGDDWQPEQNLKVDAITSASRMTNVDQLVRMIVGWVETEGIHWIPDDQLLALKYLPETDASTACAAIDQKSAYYRMVYPDLVRELNRVGYYYLRLNKVDAALEIFRLNIHLFPDEWNVYDSFGEALAIRGEREAAIINYTKALELNPDSKSAKKALIKLGTG